MPQPSPPAATPSRARSLDRIEIVLCQTSMAENIGAAARAMKTMGLSRLVLVAPRVDRAAIDDRARAVATHAADLLDAARVVDSVDQAVADSVAVWATSARVRRLALPLLDGRGAAAEIVRRAGSLGEGSTERISILFGAERTGLTNGELGVADHLLALHANPDFPVLNLAQAVQLVAYELLHAARAPEPAAAGGEPAAPRGELATLCARLEEALAERGYFPGDEPADEARHARRLMQRIAVMLNRAEPRRDELRILQGMLTALTRGRRDGTD